MGENPPSERRTRAVGTAGDTSAAASDALRLDLLDRQQWSLEYVPADEPEAGWLVRDFFGDVVTNGHASPRLALDAAIADLAGASGRATP